MDSKLNRSEGQEKKRLGTGDEEKRERVREQKVGKERKGKSEKDGKIFYSRT